MRIHGERGGFCCPPNAGNPSLACSCSSELKLNIVTVEHEIGHWWLKYVAPQMVRDGLLKLPKFEEKHGWKWTAPNNSYAEASDCITEKFGDFGDFLWNARMQKKFRIIGKENIQLPVKKQLAYLHHFVQYSVIHPYLSFVSDGEQKIEQRKQLEEDFPNVFKLLKQLWPCDNKYVPACEDSAYGMKKGAAQRLLIGQRSPDTPTQMVCKDVDTSEIGKEEVKLVPLPTGDIYLGKSDDSPANIKVKAKCKCNKIAKAGGWVEQHPSKCMLVNKELKKYNENGRAWSWAHKNLATVWTQNEDDDEYELKMEPGAVTKRLADSNEYAWYLRKCCRRSARIGLTSSN